MAVYYSSNPNWKPSDKTATVIYIDKSGKTTGKTSLGSIDKGIDTTQSTKDKQGNLTTVGSEISKSINSTTQTTTQTQNLISKGLESGDLQGFSGTTLNPTEIAKAKLLDKINKTNTTINGEYVKAVTNKGQEILKQVSKLEQSNLTAKQQLSYNLPKAYNTQDISKIDRRLMGGGGTAEPITAEDLATLTTGVYGIARAGILTGSQILLSKPIAEVNQRIIDYVIPTQNSGFSIKGLPAQAGRGALFLASTPLTGKAYATQITKGLITNPLETSKQLYEYAVQNPYEVIVITAPNVYGILKDPVSQSYIKLGSKKVDTNKVFYKDVLNKKTKFPESKSTAESIQRFKDAKDGDYLVAQTSTTIKPKISDKSKAGTKAKVGLEDTGIYVTPKGEGSPYFFRFAKNIKTEYTSNPFKLFEKNKPSVLEIKYKEISTYPKEVLNKAGFDEVNKFLKEQQGSGKIFISKRSMLGQGELKPQLYKRNLIEVKNPKTGETIKDIFGNPKLKEVDPFLQLEQGTVEIEAIVSGNILREPLKNVLAKIKGYDSYTIYEGKAIPIRKYKLAENEKIPNTESLSVQSNKIKKEIAKYTEQSSDYFNKPNYKAPVSSISLSSINKSLNKYYDNLSSQINKSISSMSSDYTTSSKSNTSTKTSSSTKGTSSKNDYISNISRQISESISNIYPDSTKNYPKNSNKGSSSSKVSSSSKPNLNKINYPNIPKTTIKILPFNEKKQKSKSNLGEGYFAYGKLIKSNLFKKINQSPVTRSRAEDIGSFYVSNSIARSFKIIKANTKARPDYEFSYIPEGYYNRVSNRIRNFRIKQGSPWDEGQIYIEKSKYLLDTDSEKRQIQKFNKIIRSLTK